MASMRCMGTRTLQQRAPRPQLPPQAVGPWWPAATSSAPPRASPIRASGDVDAQTPADSSPRAQEQQQQGRHQPQRTAARRPRVRPSPTSGDGGPLLTFEEVQAAASAKGLCLYRRTLGPFYRIVCRQGNEEGQVLGVTNGFVAPPFKLAHCDTLQIFTKGLRGDEGLRIRGGTGLGVALLLGGAVFAHAWGCGCTKAEILAINDDDAWHERLVRYYSFFGFSPVTTVGGNGLADLPHLLVWGGEGTRMDADIEGMLRKWGPTIRRGAAASDTSGGGGSAFAGTRDQGLK